MPDVGKVITENVELTDQDRDGVPEVRPKGKLKAITSILWGVWHLFRPKKQPKLPVPGSTTPLDSRTILP